MNDYIVACIELMLDGGTQFDFGEEESEGVDQIKKEDILIPPNQKTVMREKSLVYISIGKVTNLFKIRQLGINTADRSLRRINKRRTEGYFRTRGLS